jgi:hypothetical protein
MSPAAAALSSTKSSDVLTVHGAFHACNANGLAVLTERPTAPDLNPALLFQARDAAVAKWYALDRPQLSDAEVAKFQPMMLRVLNAQQRQIMIRFTLTDKELG